MGPSLQNGRTPLCLVFFPSSYLRETPNFSSVAPPYFKASYPKPWQFIPKACVGGADPILPAACHPMLSAYRFDSSPRNLQVIGLALVTQLPQLTPKLLFCRKNNSSSLLNLERLDYFHLSLLQSPDSGLFEQLGPQRGSLDDMASYENREKSSILELLAGRDPKSHVLGPGKEKHLHPWRSGFL